MTSWYYKANLTKLNCANKVYRINVMEFVPCAYFGLDGITYVAARPSACSLALT